MYTQILCHKMECNKFKYISSDEEWDELEYIVARKLIAQLRLRVSYNENIDLY